MQIDIAKLLKRDRQLKAIIGMDKRGFEILHKEFSEIYYKKKKVGRKRGIGGGRKGVIKDTRVKLLFILLYIKVYPTYDVAGALFGVVASRPCEWVKEYKEILEEALGRHCALPARRIRSIEEFRRLCPSVDEVIADGTERRIWRPRSRKNGKKSYSGKVKSNTRKNVLLTTRDRKILYLSPTKGGREHDFGHLKKTGVIGSIPKDVDIVADKGFIGLDYLSDSKVFIPRKKPRNGALSQKEKEENALIASHRIKVEHSIGGVKRFGICTNTYRGRYGSDDHFLYLSSGLWNFHLIYAA